MATRAPCDGLGVFSLDKKLPPLEGGVGAGEDGGVPITLSITLASVSGVSATPAGGELAGGEKGTYGGGVDGGVRSRAALLAAGITASGLGGGNASKCVERRGDNPSALYGPIRPGPCPPFPACTSLLYACGYEIGRLSTQCL